MKVIRFENGWTLQLYRPTYTRIKGGFNLRAPIALTIARDCFGFELLGFGFGIGAPDKRIPPRKILP